MKDMVLCLQTHTHHLNTRDYMRISLIIREWKDSVASEHKMNLYLGGISSRHPASSTHLIGYQAAVRLISSISALE